MGRPEIWPPLVLPEGRASGRRFHLVQNRMRLRRLLGLLPRGHQALAERRLRSGSSGCGAVGGGATTDGWMSLGIIVPPEVVGGRDQGHPPCQGRGKGTRGPLDLGPQGRGASPGKISSPGFAGRGGTGGWGPRVHGGGGAAGMRGPWKELPWGARLHPSP